MRDTIREKEQNFIFTKRQVVIEAFKAGIDFIPDWFMDKVTSNDVILHSTQELGWCEIKTLEGIMLANKGDYIIQGIAGELYPCKPEIFEATYSPGNKTKYNELMQELEDEEDLHTPFVAINEAYNALHEALRDFRRDITHEAPQEVLLDNLFQIGMIAMFARKDLKECSTMTE